MNVTQLRLTDWNQMPAPDEAVQLLLVFSSRFLLSRDDAYPALRQAYPCAIIAGSSTAGEISDTHVSDDEIIITAVHFSSTRLRCEKAYIVNDEHSKAAGQRLGRLLLAPDLVHVLMFSDGLLVNGSELVSGIREVLPPGVPASGGLAGDGADFQHTVVMANAAAEQRVVVAIGFYGERLHVGCGSLGGWDPFGPDRQITRANNNVVYELDGQPALDLYRTYLGPRADELPSSGLLFPLAIELPGTRERIVRTILAIDAHEKSLTFAGDMPEGAYAQLMRANFDRLVAGATAAAETSFRAVNASSAQLAILISCVGRRLVLKQRVEEEIEGVREVVGSETVICGFYSYGEIAPLGDIRSCELHNQTMTITLFSEV